MISIKLRTLYVRILNFNMYKVHCIIKTDYSKCIQSRLNLKLNVKFNFGKITTSKLIILWLMVLSEISLREENIKFYMINTNRLLMDQKFYNKKT